MQILGRAKRALRLLSRRLWVRASLYASIGVAAALLGLGAEKYYPWPHSVRVSADALNRVLDMLAASMLTVTTFSLGIVVTAYGMATSNVSPRAARLLTEDTSSQRVLATFIGSFLFSLVAIIALSTGLYGDSGRSVLVIATLAMVLIVVIAMLRWIEQLSRLGRVDTTTELVEETTLDAIERLAQRPYGGGRPIQSGAGEPPGAATVFGDALGYVAQLDVAPLEDIAGETGTQIFVAAPVGTFLDGRRPVAWITGQKAAEVVHEREEDIRGCFHIEPERSFDNDIRFGLVVLAEIASRALSPAVNDPGTAIDVIGRGTRVLSVWNDTVAKLKASEKDRVACEHVFVPVLAADDLLDDLFGPIARDGAGNIEVQTRLHKALAAIAATCGPDFAAAASHHAKLALKRSDAAMSIEDDKRKLHALFAAWPATPDGEAVRLKAETKPE